jgi:hypothetical protein
MGKFTEWITENREELLILLGLLIFLMSGDNYQE